MPEIKIVSMYNGRYHISTIKRAERVCQIAVDGKVVYDDESENEQGNPADGLKCSFCGRDVDAIRCYECRYAG